MAAEKSGDHGPAMVTQHAQDPKNLATVFAEVARDAEAMPFPAAKRDLGAGKQTANTSILNVPAPDSGSIARRLPASVHMRDQHPQSSLSVCSGSRVAAATHQSAPNADEQLGIAADLRCLPSNGRRIGGLSQVLDLLPA